MYGADPRDSKFHFHVAVDVECLRCCSKIFVMLLTYDNRKYSIMQLGVKKVYLNREKRFYCADCMTNFGLSIDR